MGVFGVSYFSGARDSQEKLFDAHLKPSSNRKTFENDVKDCLNDLGASNRHKAVGAMIKCLCKKVLRGNWAGASPDLQQDVASFMFPRMSWCNGGESLSCLALLASFYKKWKDSLFVELKRYLHKSIETVTCLFNFVVRWNGSCQKSEPVYRIAQLFLTKEFGISSLFCSLLAAKLQQKCQKVNKTNLQEMEIQDIAKANIFGNRIDGMRRQWNTAVTLSS